MQYYDPFFFFFLFLNRFYVYIFVDLVKYSVFTLVGEIQCYRNDCYYYYYYYCYYYKEDGVQLRECILVMTVVSHGHLFVVVIVVAAWVFIW